MSITVLQFEIQYKHIWHISYSPCYIKLDNCLLDNSNENEIPFPYLQFMKQFSSNRAQKVIDYQCFKEIAALSRQHGFICSTLINFIPSKVILISIISYSLGLHALINYFVDAPLGILTMHLIPIPKQCLLTKKRKSRTDQQLLCTLSWSKIPNSPQ